MRGSDLPFSDFLTEDYLSPRENRFFSPPSFFLFFIPGLNRRPLSLFEADALSASFSSK